MRNLRQTLRRGSQSTTPGEDNGDPIPNGPTVFTRVEAAILARLSVATIDREIRRGRLKATRVGRRVLIAEENLRSWLDTFPVAATIDYTTHCDMRHIGIDFDLLVPVVALSFLHSHTPSILGWLCGAYGSTSPSRRG